MRVDANIVASRWRLYAQWLGILILIGIIICSDIALLWQILLSILLVLLQGWTEYLFRQRSQQHQQLLQLWQDDGQHWYWRIQGSRRTYRGRLLTLRCYGVLVYGVLQAANHKQQRVVLWRDQVSETQWRYLRLRSHLKP